MRTIPATKQIGAKINARLWKEIRMIALETDRLATDLLNEAMQDFIKKHGKGRGRFSLREVL